MEGLCLESGATAPRPLPTCQMAEHFISKVNPYLPNQKKFMKYLSKILGIFCRKFFLYPINQKSNKRRSLYMINILKLNTVNYLTIIKTDSNLLNTLYTREASSLVGWFWPIIEDNSDESSSDPVISRKHPTWPNGTRVY